MRGQLERRPPTIRDVARRAGVSIATVSRVLNDAGEVSAATAETVRRVVEDLGFRPNRHGRSLKTSRSHLIAVVVDAPLVLAADTLAGCERAARAAGYAVLLSVADGDTARAEAVDLMHGHGAGGIVVLSTATDAPHGLPTVVADPAGGAAAGAAAVARLLADGSP